MSRARGRRLVVTACMLVALAPPAPAEAHTDLVGSIPGAGDVVAAAPGDVTLAFSTDLVAEGTQVVVRDPGGRDLATTWSTFGSQVRVRLGPVERSGTYAVTYRAVAGDGHPVTGDYRFRVPARALTVDTATAADRGSGEASGSVASGRPVARSSSGGALVDVLGAGSLALLLVVGARRRRERDGAPS